MIDKVFKIGLLMLLLFLMSVFGMGCAGTMYIPQSLESEDKATLSLIEYYDEAGKSKFFIDGELTYDCDLDVRRTRCGMHIYVLPGKHKLRNINESRLVLSDFESTFYTEAGYKYNVEADRRDGEVKVKLYWNKEKMKK